MIRAKGKKQCVILKVNDDCTKERGAQGQRGFCVFVSVVGILCNLLFFAIFLCCYFRHCRLPCNLGTPLGGLEGSLNPNYPDERHFRIELWGHSAVTGYVWHVHESLIVYHMHDTFGVFVYFGFTPIYT